MTKPIVVSIPHQLGAEEAQKRLKSGLEHIKQAYSGKLAVLEDHWSDRHLDFRVNALAQTVQGTVDVADDRVTLAVQLPWLLAVMAEKAKRLIEKQGHLMLEKK